MAGLSGFASHRHSLHLGAGCQWWMLEDVSGTQPPLGDAVVKAKKSRQIPKIFTMIQLLQPFNSKRSKLNSFSSNSIIYFKKDHRGNMPLNF